MVEALLFASAEPMTEREMAARMPQGSDPSAALARLQARYAGRGVELRRVGPAWALRTAPDLAFLLSREQTAHKPLSRAALETLAVVAYHQPVTRAEIEEVRGVAVSKGTLDLLLQLDWIAMGRRRMSPGRPATFVTTRAFLDHFALASPTDLPGLRELRQSGLLGGEARDVERSADAEAEGELFDPRPGDRDRSA
jgi:segregation and condensation protein B